MFQPSVDRLPTLLSAADLFLDVGGWACPFNRVQWVLDAEPYGTRGYYRTFGGAASQGADKERFARDTWLRVGKRGYSEVPLRAWESCREVEYPRIALGDWCNSGRQFGMRVRSRLLRFETTRTILDD